MRYIAVMTTTDSRDNAEAICRALVTQNLVACAQISAIESVYQWQGALQHEPEFRLWCKTTSARYSEVEALIKSLHSYQLPAIYAIAFTHIEAHFAQWLEQQSQAIQ